MLTACVWPRRLRSLGVMLFFMLSGRQAFPGNNDDEKESKILTREPNFSGKAWDAISKVALPLQPSTDTHTLIYTHRCTHTGDL